MPMRKGNKVLSPTLKESQSEKEGNSDLEAKQVSNTQSQLESPGPDGNKSSLSRKSGSFRFSFRKKIKDVVKDLETKSQTEPSSSASGAKATDSKITPAQRRFAEVANEAHAASKQQQSVEENPLKMVKLKKVKVPEKKPTVDNKRKKFVVPQLKSTKDTPKDNSKDASKDPAIAAKPKISSDALVPNTQIKSSETIKNNGDDKVDLQNEGASVSSSGLTAQGVEQNEKIDPPKCEDGLKSPKTGSFANTSSDSKKEDEQPSEKSSVVPPDDSITNNTKAQIEITTEQTQIYRSEPDDVAKIENKENSSIPIRDVSAPPIGTESPEPITITSTSQRESDDDENSNSEFHSLSEEEEEIDIVEDKDTEGKEDKDAEEKEDKDTAGSETEERIPDNSLYGPEEYSKLVSRRISFNLSKNVVYSINDGEEDEDEDSEDNEETDEEENEDVTHDEDQVDGIDTNQKYGAKGGEDSEAQENEELEQELNFSPSLLEKFRNDSFFHEVNSVPETDEKNEMESDTATVSSDNVDHLEREADLQRKEDDPEQKEELHHSEPDTIDRNSDAVSWPPETKNQIKKPARTFKSGSSPVVPDTKLKSDILGGSFPHATQELEKLETVTLEQDRPVLSLQGELQKEEDTIEKEEKHHIEEHDASTYKNRVDKLEKLIKAKENSIKTFITKNDALTSELLGVKDLLYEKDMAFRSVSDSLNIVVERCNHKSKQVQEQMETNENLSDQNAALKSEVDVMKRKVSDLESEVVDYQKLNEENNDAYKNQKQLLRKREEELLELRREFEEKIDMQSESTASVRKKAERCSNESEELREQLKKLKEKYEKEKDCHFTEIQSLEQEKTELIQKMSSTENQLKKSREEYNSMANNLTYTESDFHSLQLKFNSLTKDHASLKTDLQNHEKKVSTLTTENKSVKKELENLKIDHDTLVQQKVSHNSRIQNLQREIEDEKDRGLKNNHIIEDLKRQVQNQQNELVIANARSNEFAKSSLEEEQDMRRKWQNRIKDAEDEVNRLTAKLKLSEKTRSEQCAELEQVNYDLSSTKRTLTSLEKKHHNTEVMLEEHVNLDQENRDKIETMKRRMNEYQSQIGALKQEKEEDLRQQRELRNKIKTLTDRVEDLEHEEEISERKKQEMTRQVARLQEQVETANGTLAELHEDLEKANSRADKTHKDSLLAMEEKTNILAEKDEEIEMVKKTCRGTINLLKNQLEAAEQEISKLVLIKKELEGEIMLLQGDLDEAEATVNELNNEIPRQQDILEQLNVSLGEATSRCEALQDALVRADLKCTQLSTRNEELEDQVKQGETQKRLTDQDNIDLHNKIAEQSAKSEALLDTIAKVEAQLEAQSGIMEAMEADKSNWELERRKMRELITTLEADNQHLEEVRIGLESSENKIKCRLRDAISEHEDIMKSVKNNHRSRTRALESRVAELEGNLEEETERRTTLEKALKRLERLLKELELQGMEDTQTIERQVEQIANVNNRNKQLKTQFADAEARITSLQQKLRKLTTEVEESEGRNATMSKLLSTPAASRCPTPLRQSRVGLTSRPDTAMSWDHEGVDHQDLTNDLKQSDKLYTALMRNSVMGSRPSSRLISPEVESILLSGRNSPVGPLSILSGRNSPAAQLSPGLQRSASPAGSIGNQPKSFQFEESLLTKDYEVVNQTNLEDGGKTEDKNEEEMIKSEDNPPKHNVSQDDKIPEVILTEEGKSPVSLAKEVAIEEVKPLWETEVIVPEKDDNQEKVSDAVNGH